ncbi:hypothetical protein Q2T76_01980 [Lactobacillus sp. YT155]|uniref:hypothetical protein n=1 Tax=Lactobacillus sp. YT155 TaxID=3060955 RepID=UPI00265F8276|nr:hypothetical protein [Lactobacillus sp. YT155]MDO1604818.1 hypothetical protein [Lactobacillus sp. YT155]
MTKKTKITIISILVIILIVGCIIFFPKKSDNLTLTNIQSNVILSKTSEKNLKQLYGKPKKRNTNIHDVNKKYYYSDGLEGTINDNLDNYWNEMRYDKKAPLKDTRNYDYYLEYSGKNLGVNYVRFFFWKDRVYDIQFGNKIVNENAAKKDKYLKKILPYEG